MTDRTLLAVVTLSLTLGAAFVALVPLVALLLSIHLWQSAILALILVVLAWAFDGIRRRLRLGPAVTAFVIGAGAMLGLMIVADAQPAFAAVPGSPPPTQEPAPWT